MKATLEMNPLLRLNALGQSVWLDFLSRGILRSGKLKRLIEADGITGVTSNPAIFEKAIAGAADYDHAIAARAAQGARAESVYLSLAIEDVQAAADLLRPVYEATAGRDGFVSLEVSPHLAHDTAGTVAKARMLWHQLARPNALIKVPATAAGVPAIRTLIEDGISVNVTLLFGRARYAQIANAYVEGLTQRAVHGLPVDRVASVASFFLSRIDSLLDSRLEAMAAMGSDKAANLVGEVAITKAKLVYARYRELFEGKAFADLASQGARPQRLLWASTSTKNPAYPDTKYVEPLIGAGTVTTLPMETVDAYRDHGNPALRLGERMTEAAVTFVNLISLGVNYAEAAKLLEIEGIQKFVAPYDKLMESIASKLGNQKKRKALVAVSPAAR